MPDKNYCSWLALRNCEQKCNFSKENHSYAYDNNWRECETYRTYITIAAEFDIQESAVGLCLGPAYSQFWTPLRCRPRSVRRKQSPNVPANRTLITCTHSSVCPDRIFPLFSSSMKSSDSSTKTLSPSTMFCCWKSFQYAFTSAITSVRRSRRLRCLSETADRCLWDLRTSYSIFEKLELRDLL